MRRGESTRGAPGVKRPRRVTARARGEARGFDRRAVLRRGGEQFVIIAARHQGGERRLGVGDGDQRAFHLGAAIPARQRWERSCKSPSETSMQAPRQATQREGP